MSGDSRRYTKNNKLFRSFYKLDRRAKLAIYFGAAAIVGGGVFATTKTATNHEVYLVDLTDKYEKEATLYDANGKEVVIDSDDASELLAIVDSKKTKSDEYYPAIVVNAKGNMFAGYMDGKYLDEEIIDKVKVDNDVLPEINVVSAPDGLWLRDNEDKEINTDTEDAYLLPSESQIVTSDLFETSNSNSYEWKEAIYCNDKKLQHGYVVADYIRNVDFDKIEGKRFKVTTAPGVPLKLRKSANTDAEIIANMQNDSEVVLLPEILSFSDGTYDWFYVATKTDDGVKAGYAAATYYLGNDVIHYLDYQKEDENIKSDSKEEMIIKVVDTAKDNYVDLKLREEPGIDAKIISKIEDGTKVYTYSNLIDFSEKSEEVDGYHWLKIYLNNGKTGYVASSYLKDEDIMYDTSSLENNIQLDFGNEGVQEGYFGIDVPNGTSAASLEKLLKNDYDYSSATYSVSRDLSEMKRPTFVMIKLGASYTSTDYEDVMIAKGNYINIDNVRSMVAICEENHVPYGFYYYSQATSESDASKEAEYIHEALSQIGTSKYHIMPFAIDVEDKIYVNGDNIDTRVAINAKINGKSQQTEVVNLLMNKVRDENNIEVISYLARSGYSDLINHEQLDLVNQENCWVVNPSKVHSDDFASNYPDVVENIAMRQIALDGVVNHVPLDVNFINKDYFDKILKEHDLAAEFKQGKTKILEKTKETIAKR